MILIPFLIIIFILYIKTGTEKSLSVQWEGFVSFLPEINKFHRFDKLKDVFIYDMLEDMPVYYGLLPKETEYGVMTVEQGNSRITSIRFPIQVL